MEAVECGAASLAMILAYHGRHVPLEELRVACGVSRDGSNAANLIKAARSYGLEAKAYKREMQTLRNASLPAILFWNFNHFVVLDGYDAKGFHLNDPAVGPRSATETEIDEAFTGVALEFKPGPDFKRGGAPPSLFAGLRQRLRGSERAVQFALLAGLAIVVTGIIVPMFARIFIDQVLVRGLTGWVRPLLVAMVLTAAIRAGLVALQQYYLLRLETKLAVTTSSGFLWHLLHLPVEFYAQRYAGEISWRAGLNDEVARFLSRRLASTAIDAMMVVFFGALMFSYDVTLTLVAVAAIAVLAATTFAVNRRRIDGNRRVLQEAGKATGTLMAGLSAIETLKASAMESDFFARWAGHQAKYLGAQQSLARTTALFMMVPPLTLALTNAVVLLLGAQRVIEGEFTLGTLVAFQTLMASFIRPVNNFVNLAGAIQEMHGKMTRIDDVLRYPAAVTEDGDGQSEHAAVERLSGHVEIRNITFGYSKQAAPLIREFTLVLQPGTRVALVGSSGCGKSTIAKLVSSLYPPWEGQVLLDGLPAEAWPRATRAATVAMVDQDISLFAGTVRENLTLWDATVPEESLIIACKDAGIHSDIMARPGGIDARVEEGGANFSGGQRQRMEIARALVGNPSVLVLDEATSALDAVTEHQIDRNLRRRGCTCIIVAHRLSTIRDADEIIVLDHGEVVQRGSHEQLIEDRDGFYYALAGEN
jgi:NHLM bacteriocin system ABC transporter peptidase/ATP-binding protein